jgi:adenylate cyclase
VIFKQEGTLDKFIGDAIMAVFGAPIDMPDHASRAIKSALDMMEQLDEFNNDHRDGPKLQIRIGINSGKAVACEIGSINKKEYTVLGDTVNTASRLESSVAKPMMIVVGENTYEAVKGRFDMKPLGKATLKGKQKEVVAYQVLGELPATEATVPPSTQPEL